MRGQASFEFLVVLLIFFSFFSFWLSTISEAQRKATYGITILNTRTIADRLASTMRRVYMMGKNNAEVVSFYTTENITITTKPNLLLVSMGNRTYQREVYNAEEGTIRLSGNVNILVENKEGRVILSPRV